MTTLLYSDETATRASLDQKRLDKKVIMFGLEGNKEIFYFVQPDIIINDFCFKPVLLVVHMSILSLAKADIIFGSDLIGLSKPLGLVVSTNQPPFLSFDESSGYFSKFTRLVSPVFQAKSVLQGNELNYQVSGDQNKLVLGQVSQGPCDKPYLTCSVQL